MSSVLKVPPCSVSEVGPEFQIRPALPRKLTLLNLIPLVMKKGCWHFDNHNHIISVLSPQTENCCIFVTFGLAFLICRGKGAMLNCHVKYRSPEGTNQTLGLERAFLIFSSPRRRGSGYFSNWLQSSTSPQSILQMWPLSERPLRWIPLKTSSYTEFTVNEQQPLWFSTGRHLQVIEMQSVCQSLFQISTVTASRSKNAIIIQSRGEFSLFTEQCSITVKRLTFSVPKIQIQALSFSFWGKPISWKLLPRKHHSDWSQACHKNVTWNLTSAWRA